MPAFTEEIFGPVAPVITFRDDAEAVELANATDYGLAAAVHPRRPRAPPRSPSSCGPGWCTSTTRRSTRSRPRRSAGFGCSSNGGHFGGVANLELWTEWQWVTAREQATPFPF